jgi:Recombination endonuclease VII
VKTCSGCGEEKELDQFHRNRNMADGRLNECKACANAKQKARRNGPEREALLAAAAESKRRRYATNREKLNAQARARYWADPERHRAWMRQDRAKDPAKAAARRSAWRAANPDKVREAKRRVRETRRTRYATDKERYAADKEERAVKALFRKHGLTLVQWTELWSVQDGLCYLCRRPMSKELTSADGAVIDHDHACCEQSKSCRFCRRGLACRLCNLVIGCAHDDPARLRLIADNLEAAIRSLAASHADRPLALPLWDWGTANEPATT